LECPQKQKNALLKERFDYVGNYAVVLRTAPVTTAPLDGIASP